jgi:SnoaL-like polyketide cyclase
MKHCGYLKTAKSEGDEITMSTSSVNADTALIGVSATAHILESILAALNQGKLSEIADQFDDHFTFIDHALDIEFTDKKLLIEFFQKSREFFPDSAVEVNSTFTCGDHAIAVWKLKATQTESYGSQHYRFPIVVAGSTIISVKNGRVIRWSDYYDQLTSRRTGLAASFKEWIEY